MTGRPLSLTIKNQIMGEIKNNNPENFKVSGDWASQSKSLKSRFSLLTDSDLHIEAGKDHEMLGRVQKRLDKTRDEAIRIIRSAEREKPTTPPNGKI